MTSIANWHHNHQNVIRQAESDYITHTPAFFSLVPKSKSPLRRLCERSTHFRIFRYWRVTKTDLETHDQKNEFYTSGQSIDTCVSVVVTLVGLAMLIAPLWILNFTDDAVRSLAIITTFVVLFLVLVSYVTVARAFEALGATAAYVLLCAVYSLEYSDD
jgi:L-asparagine transporter-like permease